MTGLKKVTLALAAAGLLSSGVAQAALTDRGGGLLYDDVLNVTWLQDANYAQTSGYDADGLMGWNQATNWAANLSYYDSVRNVTYTDWRLPTVNPINGSAFDYSTSYNGSTDIAQNISEQGTPYAGSARNEMAYLFYNSLDNKGQCDPATSTASYCSPQAGWGLTDVGPFANFQSAEYWSDTEFATSNGSAAWSFYFSIGVQGYDSKGTNRYAWAIRTGDVAAAVPEPESYALLLAGLGLLGFMARRRKQKEAA